MNVKDLERQSHDLVPSQAVIELVTTLAFQDSILRIPSIFIDTSSTWMILEL